MKLVAPKFWYHKNLWARLLYPLGVLYGFVANIRRKLGRPQKVSPIVICVGNITMGGSGKTPVALALGNLLKENLEFSDSEIAFVTRGYGGSNLGPILVNPALHNQAEVGDEALLLAKTQAVWVARNRYQGAYEASKIGAKILILDDGLQHYSLHQEIKFLVVDGKLGFGNEYVFPAGPLRESLRQGLRHIDAIIIVGPDCQNIMHRFQTIKPVFQAFIKPRPETAEVFKITNILAFAGIGYPQKFQQFLLNHKFNLVDFQSFPDHYHYKEKDLIQLKHKAETCQATLVTTEKDYVRLPDDFKPYVRVCGIYAEFQEPKILLNFIKDKLDNGQ